MRYRGVVDAVGTFETGEEVAGLDFGVVDFATTVVTAVVGCSIVVVGLKP